MEQNQITVSSSAVVAMAAAAALITMLLPLLSAAGAGGPPPRMPMIGKPGCKTRCGNVSVPFPFGFGPARCSATGMNLSCDNTTRPGEPPRLLLGDDGVFQVTEISLHNGTLRVVTPPIFSKARWKWNHSAGGSTSGPVKGSWGGGGLNELQYIMAGITDDSKGPDLVVLGCNVEATLHAMFSSGMYSITGCSIECSRDRALNAQDLRTYNEGVCRISIGTFQTSFDVELRRLGDGGGINDDLPASVLIVDSDLQLDIDLADQLVHLMNLDRPSPKDDDDLPLLPVILGWRCLDDGSCNASVSDHSSCTRDEPLFFCVCMTGYDGNPYVTGGCQDIDECKHPKVNGCFGKCSNKNGSFDCWCPRGYHGNASQPDGCVKTTKNTGLIIGLSVSVVPCLILLALVGILIIHKLKHHRAEKLKMKFFNQNRGQLLQQLVSNRSDIGERMIIPLKELEKATNNFDHSRKVGGGGHGTVYKGILSELQVVAIKKSNIVVQREIDEFINEVAILSQINHRNVVKLYGCCLETEVPLLAYEFISNGTLSEHLHHGSPRSISWRDRLRIASEVGKAIAYLHSAVSIPVIHRDIKSSNILLDDALTAKVSDFGASRYIPIDQTGITATAVQGTIGYLDPMYYYTGQLSEMSNVYSFGVLLVELLTREMPITYRSSEGDGLVMQFVKLLEQDNLVDLLDSQVVAEGGSELQEVVCLAASCLKLNGEERPTMRQIEIKLECLQAIMEHVLFDSRAIQNEENYIEIRYPSTARSTSLDLMSRLSNQEENFSLRARYTR